MNLRPKAQDSPTRPHSPNCMGYQNYMESVKTHVSEPHTGPCGMEEFQKALEPLVEEL